MEINSSIFGSYDIRGIYPTDLTEKTAYQVGRAFVASAKVKKVVVGRDGRISSPQLFRALTRGIRDQGADVYDIGQVPTECVYITVARHGYDAGIMITASHNPKEYNGLKVVRKGVDFVRGSELLEMVSQETPHAAHKRGSLREVDIWDEYINHILSFVNLQNIKPFKIVVDAGNGMAGKVISKLQDSLPVEIIPLNFDVDGNFPAHAPNPLLEGSADQIKEKIQQEHADFGFLFDGDADRIVLVTEQGERALSGTTLLLLARSYLNKYPGSGIVYNVVCSRAVPEFIKKWGGKPIRSPVGFVNIRENMIQHGSVMGGELSGHYAFKDNFYSDSGFIAFLILLEVISSSGKRVSELVTELTPYVKSPELNFKIEDKAGMMEKLKQAYADGTQDLLDGVTTSYPDWWFNLRPSNTEPLLRLTIEAATPELLEEKIKEITSLIEPLRGA